jgi:hypothetical protein
MMAANILRLACILLLFGLSGRAQWINEPTRGIPRTPDGKPNLSASAPRTADGKPDFSGLWRPNVKNEHFGANIAADVKPDDLRPESEALFLRRREELGKDDPSVFQCLPFGPRAMLALDMFKIFQAPNAAIVLFEDLTYRQIFLDGRELSKDPNPAFMGYSTGHWEGDTLVVESNGFNERTWIDHGGHSHSEALRTTERFRRPDFGHMEVQETLSDPAVASVPWTIDLSFELLADTEMIEYVCAENEKDRAHLVGKASDDAKDAVTVSPAILAKYVGAYELRWPKNPDTVYVFNITLTNGVLYYDLSGKDRKPLIPLSETLFSTSPGRLEFIEEGGTVTHFVTNAVEGELKGIRRR